MFLGIPMSYNEKTLFLFYKEIKFQGLEAFFRVFLRGLDSDFFVCYNINRLI